MLFLLDLASQGLSYILDLVIGIREEGFEMIGVQVGMKEFVLQILNIFYLFQELTS